MYLEHFICLVIGIVLSSIFYHMYYYNGKIIFDKTNPDKNAFKLCILKVDRLKHRKYVIFKISEEHFIYDNHDEMYD